MAATTGTAAIGTLIQRSTDGVTYTTIAEVTNFSGPTRDMALLEMTHMESPDFYREYLPSLLDGGELSVTVNFLPGNSTQTDLLSDFDNRTNQYWKIIFTDAGLSEYTFRGYVSQPPNPSGAFDGKLEATITIRVTGKVTLA